MFDGNVCLNIRLMGTPEILSGGLPLASKHLKPHALMFQRVDTGQRPMRAHIATLLWEESSQNEAHHSLEKGFPAKFDGSEFIGCRIWCVRVAGCRICVERFTGGGCALRCIPTLLHGRLRLHA